jgi:hypothetical protein
MKKFNIYTNSTLYDFLESSYASDVTVLIDGQMTRGYELGGLRTGILPETKNIRANPVWLNQTRVNHNVSSVGVEMPLHTLNWSIHTSNPAVGSAVDTNNRDIRLSLNHINQ